jgi:hypothetical protein
VNVCIIPGISIIIDTIDIFWNSIENIDILKSDIFALANSYVLNSMEMENGIEVDAIYTDFSKALYKVSHRLLLRKLAKMGVGGSFLVLVGSYLTGRVQFMKAVALNLEDFLWDPASPGEYSFGTLALYFIHKWRFSYFKSLRILPLMISKYFFLALMAFDFDWTWDPIKYNFLSST